MVVDELENEASEPYFAHIAAVTPNYAWTYTGQVAFVTFDILQMRLARAKRPGMRMFRPCAD